MGTAARGIKHKQAIFQRGMFDTSDSPVIDGRFEANHKSRILILRTTVPCPVPTFMPSADTDN